MIYTDKFAFIHIPKTSGMSIKKSIKLNCPDAIYMPRNTFSTANFIPSEDWRIVMHYPYSYWELYTQDKWVFSVVRNPFIRAVSFYVYLKTTYTSSSKFTSLTFEELYTKKENAHIDISSTSQTKLLTGNNNNMVPNIFKYEDGYADIEDILGFKISQKINITPAYNYLDYYNESREKLIINLFEEDFENFNYSTILT
jgi:hypothetical protein